MFEALLTHITRFVTLTTAEQELLNTHLAFKHVGKKEYILTEGDICTANYFVLKGCFRMYFIKDTDNLKLDSVFFIKDTGNITKRCFLYEKLSQSGMRRSPQHWLHLS